MNHYLFITNELNTNGSDTQVLGIIFFLAVLFGILTINSKNPISSLLYLIMLFGVVSSYLILLGLVFLGLAYLIVYIGAVSMLFLFIIMLLDIRISELVSNTKNSIALALFISVLFFYNVILFLPYYKEGLINPVRLILGPSLSLFEDTDYLVYISSSSWDESVLEITHISGIGNVLYSNYGIWLLISSFILLLAMVGAIIITIKKPS